MDKNEQWFWKNCSIQRKKPARCCLGCPFVDYKTGYRKPKDKPPLLSDEKIQNWCDTYAIHFYVPYAKDLLQAQRELDIRFYEGK